jgi:hypothetical protein
MESPEVVSASGCGRSPAFLAALFLLLVAAAPLRAAEVYGKPLRGLSAVPVRDVVADPGRYAGRDVRVAGENAGSEGTPALRDGEAVLPLVTDGTFKLPGRLAGARLVAEGRVKQTGGTVVFVASGVEVTR